MFKILLLKGERNDATDHYVNIIKIALEEINQTVNIIDSLSDIKSMDKVITITPKAFFYVFIKNRKQFIMHWFQGITPEEAIMDNRFDPMSNFRYCYLSFIETLILKFSKLNFFVSESMLNHYRRKYRYNFENYIIMPCFNQLINFSAFNVNKYKEPTFVYTGSLSKWQCFEEALLIFSLVQKEISSAKIYIYTSEMEKAKELLKKYKIYNNSEVDYVSYKQLNDKLENFKYGFLIRRDINVNNVATPTKMNGYLANGIIPIFSDVIDDFKRNINGKYLLTADTVKEIVEKIIAMESQEIDVERLKEDYSLIFDNYYNEPKYIKLIMSRLESYF
jgi:hypothetical protein